MQVVRLVILIPVYLLWTKEISAAPAPDDNLNPRGSGVDLKKLDPETLALPDSLTEFYGLLKTNYSLLHHAGYVSALKTALQRRSHKNIYIVLLGSQMAGKLDFLNSALPNGIRRFESNVRNGPAITEYEFPITAPDLPLTKPTLRIIDVPEFVSPTNNNANAYGLSTLKEFLEEHSELKNRLPNLVITFSTFNARLHQLSESGKFVRLYDKVPMFHQNLFDSDYSNALFIGNSDIRGEDISCSKRNFQLSLERELLTGNAEILSTGTSNLPVLITSNVFRRKLQSLFQRTGDKLAEELLLGKFLEVLKTDETFHALPLQRLSTFNLRTNHRFNLSAYDESEGEIPPPLQRHLDAIQIRQNVSSLDIEILKKILTKHARQWSNPPAPKNLSVLIDICGAMQRILDPEVLNLVSMDQVLDLKAPKLNPLPAVGQSYDVINDAVLTRGPFNTDALLFQTSAIGFSLPNFIHAQLVDDSEFIFETHASEDKYFYQRLHRMNLQADHRMSSGEIPVGVNIPGITEHLTGLMEFREFAFFLNTQHMTISKEFRADVMDLPKFNPEDIDAIEAWHEFFSYWGTHVVQRSFMGGAIEIRRPNVNLNSQPNVISNSPPNVISNSPPNMLESFANVYFHLDNSDRTNFTDATTRLTFLGGNVDGSPGDLQRWKTSLRYQPTRLSNGQEFINIVEIMSKVVPEITADANLALQHYLIWDSVSGPQIFSSTLSTESFLQGFNQSLNHELGAISNQFTEEVQGILKNSAAIDELGSKLDSARANVRLIKSNMAEKAEQIFRSLNKTQNLMVESFKNESRENEEVGRIITSKLDELLGSISNLEDSIVQNFQEAEKILAEQMQRFQNYSNSNFDNVQRMLSQGRNVTDEILMDAISGINLEFKDRIAWALQNLTAKDVDEELVRVENQVVNQMENITRNFQTTLNLRNFNMAAAMSATREELLAQQVQRQNLHGISRNETLILIENELQNIPLLMQPVIFGAIKSHQDTDAQNSAALRNQIYGIYSNISQTVDSLFLKIMSDKRENSKLALHQLGNMKAGFLNLLPQHMGNISTEVTISNEGFQRQQLNSNAEILENMKIQSENHSNNASDSRRLYHLDTKTKLTNFSMQLSNQMNSFAALSDNRTDGIVKFINSTQNYLQNQRNIEQGRNFIVNITQVLNERMKDLESLINSTANNFLNGAKPQLNLSLNEILDNLLNHNISVHKVIENLREQISNPLAENIVDAQFEIQFLIAGLANASMQNLIREYDELRERIEAAGKQTGESLNQTQAAIVLNFPLQANISSYDTDFARGNLHDNITQIIEARLDSVGARMLQLQEFLQNVTKTEVTHPGEVQSLNRTVSALRKILDPARFQTILDLARDSGNANLQGIRKDIDKEKETVPKFRSLVQEAQGENANYYAHEIKSSRNVLQNLTEKNQEDERSLQEFLAVLDKNAQTQNLSFGKLANTMEEVVQEAGAKSRERMNTVASILHDSLDVGQRIYNNLTNARNELL